MRPKEQPTNASLMVISVHRFRALDCLDLNKMVHSAIGQNMSTARAGTRGLPTGTLGLEITKVVHDTRGVMSRSLPRRGCLSHLA